MTNLLLNLLILFAIVVTLKRALVGPQKIFARVATILITVGGIGIWMSAPNKESLQMHVSAWLFMTGLTVHIAMFAFDCVWLFRNRSDQSTDA